jgi:Putative zinc-finger
VTAPVTDHPGELLPWYVNGTLAGEERRRVEAHLASCLACRREVAELEGLRRDVKAAAAQAPPGPEGLARLLRQVERERGLPRRGWWRPWSLAAAVAVVVGGLALWWTARGPARVEYREGEPARIRSLVGPEEALPRSRFLLRWETDEDLAGARFDVWVTTATLDPVFEKHGLTAPALLVPGPALAGLRPGTKLYWQVEAVSPAGDRLRSPTFRVWVE